MGAPAQWPRYLITLSRGRACRSDQSRAPQGLGGAPDGPGAVARVRSTGRSGAEAFKPLLPPKLAGRVVRPALKAASSGLRRGAILEGPPVPLDPSGYSGLRGEGSIPVALPPPSCPRPGILQVNSRAKKPSNSCNFSLGPGPSNGQSRPIVLRYARFSPKLWTLSIRYGSRNSNFWSNL